MRLTIAKRTSAHIRIRALLVEMQVDVEDGIEGYSSKLKQVAMREVYLGGQRELIGLGQKYGKILLEQYSPRT